VGTSQISIGEIGKAVAIASPSSVRNVAIGITVLGLMVTTLLTLLVYRGESSRMQLSLQRDAARVHSALERRFLIPYEIVYSIGSFFLASEHVSHKEFVVFSESSLSRNPSVSALEWAPVVKGSERPELENSLEENEGLVGFRIRSLHADGTLHPSPERPLYVPILYLEPPVPEILGMDLASDPDRRSRLELAALATKPVASEPFRLAEDPEGELTVALYLGIPDRQLSLEETWGFAIALFRLEPILTATREELVDFDVQYAVIDVTSNSPSVILESATLSPLRETVVRSFGFGGRSWQVHVQRANQVGSTWTMWFGGVGVTFSFLFGGLFFGLGRSRQLARDIEVAKEMGQYRIMEKIGQGGMGVVYKAQHSLMLRNTAVKVLLGRDEASLKRFEREVQLTAQLSHPNTVSVFDYGHTERGDFYYAMELLDGITLQEVIDRSGPMPVGRALHILVQILGSLREAHQKGLIHRDIKPENIMITRQGGVFDFVKVLDFGLAKKVEGDLKVTGHMEILGTPLYMAPEAMHGKDLDGQADVYSVACVAFNLLRGEVMFESSSVMELMRQHEMESPPDLDSSIPELNELIGQCLSKDPQDRPATWEFHQRVEKLTTLVPWTQAQAEEWWSTHLMTGELTPLVLPLSDSEA